MLWYNYNGDIMICKNCGSEIDNNQKVCPKCGELLGDEVEQENKKLKTIEINNGFIFYIFALIFPIFGFIIYIFGSKAGLIKSKGLLITSIIGLLFRIFLF